MPRSDFPPIGDSLLEAEGHQVNNLLAEVSAVDKITEDILRDLLDLYPVDQVVASIRAVPEKRPRLGIPPHALKKRIDDLDFSARLQNLIRRRGLETIGDLRGLTWEDWLDTQNLGKKSIAEFVSKLSAWLGISAEKAAAQALLDLGGDRLLLEDPGRGALEQYGLFEVRHICGRDSRVASREAAQLGLLLLDWLLEDRAPAVLVAQAGAVLADPFAEGSAPAESTGGASAVVAAPEPTGPLAPCSLIDSVDWHDWQVRVSYVFSLLYSEIPLDDLREVDLARLAVLSEVPEDARSRPVGELHPFPPVSISAVGLIKLGLTTLDPRRREILLRTTFCGQDEQETLEDVAGSFGVSRERIRQLRNRALELFEDRVGTAMSLVAKVLFERLGSAFPFSALLSEVRMGADESADPAVLTATCRALVRATDGRIKNGWVSQHDLADVRAEWRRRLRDEGGRHGLVTSEAMGEFARESGIRADFRDAFLVEWIQLTPFKGRWLRSSSNRDSVQGALEIRGEPSTKDEIAEMTGLDPSVVRATLSNLDSVCRADLRRWGFHEWVDDVYEGIAAEIIQRINASNDGWVDVDGVVDELVQLFEVAEASVRTYFSAKRFICEDGQARLVGPDELQAMFWGAVEEESTAVPLEDGTWGGVVSVEERHFRGYSFMIPASIGAVQGLQPDSRLVVPVRGTTSEASLNWSIDLPTNRVTVGRISEVLNTLAVQAGDSIVISPSPSDVRIWALERAPVGRESPGRELVREQRSPERREDVLRALFRR